MVSTLLKKKPQDPVPHMVQFLEELQGTATPALSPEEHLELEQLRIKYEKLKKSQAPMAAASSATSKPAKKKKDSDSSSDSEGEEDVGELPVVMA